MSNTTVESHCTGVGCSKSLCLKQSSKSVDMVIQLAFVFCLKHCLCGGTHPGQKQSSISSLLTCGVGTLGSWRQDVCWPREGRGNWFQDSLCKHPKSDKSLVGIRAACSTRPYTVHEVMLSAASRCIKTISGKLWQTLWTKNKEG